MRRKQRRGYAMEVNRLQLEIARKIRRVLEWWQIMVAVEMEKLKTNATMKRRKYSDGLSVKQERENEQQKKKRGEMLWTTSSTLGIMRWVK